MDTKEEQKKITAIAREAQAKVGWGKKRPELADWLSRQDIDEKVQEQILFDLFGPEKEKVKINIKPGAIKVNPLAPGIHWILFLLVFATALVFQIGGESWLTIVLVVLTIFSMFKSFQGFGYMLFLPEGEGGAVEPSISTPSPGHGVAPAKMSEMIDHQPQEPNE